MLSKVIPDKVFHGVLDQRCGCHLVFDEPEVDVSVTQCTIPVVLRVQL